MDGAKAIFTSWLAFADAKTADEAKIASLAASELAWDDLAGDTKKQSQALFHVCVCDAGPWSRPGDVQDGSLVFGREQ